MLARVAESLYWVARYCERAEDMARLINVNAHAMLDLPKGVAPGWERLIAITGASEEYRETGQDFREAQVVSFLVADPRASTSILFSINQARENARTIRDVIPREAWEHINAFALWMRERADTALGVRTRFDFLNEVIARCQTLNGMLAGSMNHDHGYLFFRLGRNLERADMTTRIIDVRSADMEGILQDDRHRRFEHLQWMSVLKSLTAYQMYRQRMSVAVRREEVLTFLFQSDVFPRAVLHCLLDLEAGIQTLPRNEGVLEILAQALQTVRCDVASFNHLALHQFIDQVQIHLNAVGQALTDQYFWTGMATRYDPLRQVA